MALGRDRLLLARQHQAGATVAPQPVRPHGLVITNRNPAAMAQVQNWRAEGYRLQVEVNGRGLADVLAYAAQIGAEQVFVWETDGFVTYRRSADGAFVPGQGEIFFDE